LFFLLSKKSIIRFSYKTSIFSLTKIGKKKIIFVKAFKITSNKNFVFFYTFLQGTLAACLLKSSSNWYLDFRKVAGKGHAKQKNILTSQKAHTALLKS